MRIKSLKIKKYKNIKNLIINFIDENIDIFIGINGSGKSNIYEFILKVFRKIGQKDKHFPYEFELEYEITIDGNINLVKLQGDGEKITILINDNFPHYTLPYSHYTPKNIIVYYSGTSKRLRSIYSEYILHIKDEHFPLIFTSLLTSTLPRNRIFLEKFFNINIMQGIKIDLRIKNFFQLDTYIKKEIIQEKDEESLEYLHEIEEYIQKNIHEISFYSYLEKYWSEIESRFNIALTHQKKKRIDFLRNLTRYSRSINFHRDNKYIDIVINTNCTEEEGLQEYDIDFFKNLFDVHKGKYLHIEDITFTRQDIPHPISYKDLSEGETQFILTQGILELFAADENIILLDEADTYLHPSWQRKILNNLRESISESIHVLFTSHSPQTIGHTKRENIFILENGKVKDISSYSLGRDSNWILSQLMDTAERDEKVIMRIDEIYKLLDNETYDEAEYKLNTLEEEIGTDDKDIIRLRTILEFSRD